MSHTYLLVDGGDGLNMFMNDEAVLLDLDNKALIEHIQYDLKGVIGSEYANLEGQGAWPPGPTPAAARAHPAARAPEPAATPSNPKPLAAPAILVPTVAAAAAATAVCSRRCDRGRGACEIVRAPWPASENPYAISLRTALA